MDKGRNAHRRSRHAIAVSHPGSRCAEKSAHRCHSFGSLAHFAPPLLVQAVPLVYVSRSEYNGVAAVVLSTSLHGINLYETCRVASPPSASTCKRLAPHGHVGSGPRRRARFERCRDKKRTPDRHHLRQHTKDYREFKYLKARYVVIRWCLKYRLFHPPVNRSGIKF